MLLDGWVNTYTILRKHISNLRGTHPAIRAVWCAKSTGLNLFEIPSSKKKNMGLEDVSPTIFGLGPWSGHFIQVRNWFAASINHWENPCDRPSRIWISGIIPGSQPLFIIFYNHILIYWLLPHPWLQYATMNTSELIKTIFFLPRFTLRGKPWKSMRIHENPWKSTSHSSMIFP